MTSIVLHRVTDWPVSRHLVPVLHAAGVPEGALECFHYFHPEDVENPFEDLPEGPGFPDALDALMTASETLAEFGFSVGGPEFGGEFSFGLHWSATEAELRAAAERAELSVVLARDAKALPHAGGDALDAGRARGLSNEALICESMIWAGSFAIT